MNLNELITQKEEIEREIEKKLEEKYYPDVGVCDECHTTKRVRTGVFNAGYFAYPPINYRATLCRACSIKLS